MGGVEKLSGKSLNLLSSCTSVTFYVATQKGGSMNMAGQHDKFLQYSFLVFLIILLSLTSLPSTEAADTCNDAIPPEIVANYLHSVIEADRTVYTTRVVERMKDQGIVLASENWERKKALPLPAQLLMEAAHLVAAKNSGIQFRLSSLWPIYERNAPATEFERKGLKAVLTNPDEPYTGVITSGKDRLFQAIYADKAISNACVTCHNTHPRGHKRNFHLQDVMGGLVITIPLNP